MSSGTGWWPIFGCSLKQFVAERGIEYGLQFVISFSLNFPDFLYLKKSSKFLQSYENVFNPPNKLEGFHVQMIKSPFRGEYFGGGNEREPSPAQVVAVVGSFQTLHALRSNHKGETGGKAHVLHDLVGGLQVDVVAQRLVYYV